MKTNASYRVFAIGLLLITGSNLFSRFVWPLNDFFVGSLCGIGLGLMLVGLHRMKNPSAC